jgi:hypothetical protein
MLGYGFARATIVSDEQSHHKKEITYGSRGELALAERELMMAFPNEDDVSINKDELAMYGSSTNS